jgi:pimeloyl-ACP methyl ester carboxylesterase
MTGPGSVSAVTTDIEVGSGRLRAACWWPAGGSLVLCLPGLTANVRGFDLIGARLAATGLRVVALDMRGRGHSDITGPSTYGWVGHARDVLDGATVLGAERFCVVGWSMGAFVAMQAAQSAPGRIDRMVLIDACGAPPSDVLPLIRLALDRLGKTFPSAEDYVATMRGLATVNPWNEMWDRYFRYELMPAPGGVRARTSREAVEEDLAYIEAHDPRALWPALTMPVLLLRASRPLVPGGPWLVPETDRDDFARHVRGATIVEVDANHYGIVAHPAAIDATARFLTQ